MVQIHREPTAQRASKPIVEAMEGAKRMRQASIEAGNDSRLRYALVTERAPYQFMLNETLCRSLWPECVGFKDAIKVNMLFHSTQSNALPHLFLWLLLK